MVRCTVKSGDRTRIPIERLAVTGNKNESFVGNGIEKEVEESIVETIDIVIQKVLTFVVELRFTRRLPISRYHSINLCIVNLLRFIGFDDTENA